jgi:hypothetical protein
MSYDLVSTRVTEGIWVYLHDRQTGTTRHYGADYACAYWLDMSGDGGLLVSEGFSNCQGALEDEDFDSVVEHDVSGANRRIGTYGDLTDNYQPAISRDGRFLLWGTRPPGTRGEHVSRLQLYDRKADTTETLPLYAYHYGSTDISDDGDIIAFASNGQIYRYLRESDQLTLVSADPDGAEGDDSSEQVSISGDGRRFVFRSQASNLVPGDTNGVADIFLFDADSASIERLSVAADGTQADEESNYPWIAGDGSRVSFSSKARTLSKLSQAGNFQTYVRRVER